MSRILGLDLGSATTGWAIFSGRRLVACGKFHPGTARQGHGEKLHAFREWLVALLRKERIKGIVVERPYPGPRRNVFGVLMQFLAVVLEVHFERFGELADDHMIGPGDVKKKLKLPKQKNYEARKKQMVEWANAKHGLALRYKRNDKRGQADADTADAIAVMEAWLLGDL